MNTVIFSIVLVFLTSPYQADSKKKPYETGDKLTMAEREAEFYCYKLKSCTPGGSKVCGYDPDEPWLAVFADLCTLYKANCAQSGRFQLVPQIVCDTRIQYDKEHVNETFEYIHLSTKPSGTTKHVAHRSLQVKFVL